MPTMNQNLLSSSFSNTLALVSLLPAERFVSVPDLDQGFSTIPAHGSGFRKRLWLINFGLDTVWFRLGN